MHNKAALLFLLPRNGGLPVLFLACWYACLYGQSV